MVGGDVILALWGRGTIQGLGRRMVEGSPLYPYCTRRIPSVSRCLGIDCHLPRLGRIL